MSVKFGLIPTGFRVDPFTVPGEISEVLSMRQIRIVVEKHLNQFIAYPVGVKGGRSGVGTTYEEALERVRLPEKLYPESFAKGLVAMRPPVVEACVEGTEAGAGDY
jgi:hypothetical protein